MRGSTVERFQAYGQAIGWGWMNPNEARKKERMKPRAGGDEFLEPQSMNGALADGPMNTPPNPAGKPSGSGTKADNEEGNQSDAN